MIFNGTRYNTHWQTKKLSELGNFSRGKSKHRPRNDKKLFENGTYPLIQTGEVKAANLIINEHDAAYNEYGLKQSKLWDRGTLCITIAANIAETAILGYPMCFPDSVVGFTAYPEETSELFMHYIFTYIKKRIQSSTAGSIQDNINIDYLTALNFKIPERQEQIKIEEILVTIDRKIDINNRINKELEELAKTVYNYWFEQFNFPNVEGAPYKDSGGEMHYDDNIKREVPKEWKVLPIFEALDILYGFPFETSFFTENITETPVVRIRDIIDNSFSAYTTQPVEDKYRLKEGDLLIGMDGNFHMNFWSLDEGYLNQRSLRIRVKPDSSISVMQAYFSLKPYIKAIENRIGKTTVGHLSDTDLKRLFICAPYERNNFEPSTFFNKVLEQIISNRKQNQKLVNLRDFLLPLLMNGQIKVTNELTLFINEELVA